MTACVAESMRTPQDFGGLSDWITCGGVRERWWREGDEDEEEEEEEEEGGVVVRVQFH